MSQPWGQGYSTGGRSHQGPYSGYGGGHHSARPNSWGAPPPHYDDYGQRPPPGYQQDHYHSKPPTHYGGDRSHQGGYHPYAPPPHASHPGPPSRAKSAYQDKSYDGDWRRRHFTPDGQHEQQHQPQYQQYQPHHPYEAPRHHEAPRERDDYRRTPPFSARQSRSRSHSWAEPQPRSRSQSGGGGRGRGRDHWEEPVKPSSGQHGHYSGAVPFDHPVVVERRRLLAEQRRLREEIKRILGCAQTIKSST